MLCQANDGISSEHRLKTLMRGRARLKQRKKKESQLLRTVNYLVVREAGAFYVCSNVRVIDSLTAMPATERPDTDYSGSASQLFKTICNHARVPALLSTIKAILMLEKSS